MQEPAIVTPEVLNVFRLEEPIKAGTQCRGTPLRYLHRQIHKRRLIRFVLVVTGLTFDLRLQLAFERKPILVIDLFQFCINHGRKAIVGSVVESNFGLIQAVHAIAPRAWFLKARTRRRLQEPLSPLPGFHPSMVLLAQSLQNNLQELLSILLIATDAHAESIFEGMQERRRGDGLLVNGPLIQAVQHLLQRPGNGALL